MWLDRAGAVAEPISGEAGAFLHRAVLWTVIAAFVAAALTLGPPLLLTTCI
jgi:hypothetical protein